MSLYKYVSACNELKLELIESLPSSQIELLRKEISTSGDREWKLWFLKNLGTIKQYVRATPSKRQALKKWQDPYLKRHLSLGGIRYLTQAQYFLSRTEVYDLYPGSSYREMAAKAGWAYWDVLIHQLKIWPFDDPDPFSEDSLNAPLLLIRVPMSIF